MLKVSIVEQDKIKAGDIKLLVEVLTTRLEAVQKVVNVIKDDHRFPQGELYSLQGILDILSD